MIFFSRCHLFRSCFHARTSHHSDRVSPLSRCKLTSGQGPKINCSCLPFDSKLRPCSLSQDECCTTHLCRADVGMPPFPSKSPLTAHLTTSTMEVSRLDEERGDTHVTRCMKATGGACPG